MGSRVFSFLHGADSIHMPRTDHANFITSMRALPPAVWVLCIGTFINKFGTFVIPFMTLYLKRSGYTLTDTGLVLAAYGTGNFFASGYGGYLADKIGRRKTITFSMIGGACSMLLLSQAEGLPQLIALAALAGFSAELYRPASTAMIIDLVPVGNRVVAFAVYRTAFNAGWAFGPAAAGFLAQHSYLYLFVGEAATSLAYAIVAWKLLPKGVRGTTRETGWKKTLRTVCQDRVLINMLIGYLAIGFIFFQMSTSYGTFVSGLGFDERIYGLLLGMNGLLVVLFELPLTSFTRRFNPVHVMSVGYAFIGIGALMNALPLSLTWLFLAGAVLSFGEIVSMPVSIAYVSNLAPDHMRGRYMGVVGLVWSLTLTCSPAVGLRLYSTAPALLWGVCGASGLLAALWVLRLRNR